MDKPTPIEHNGQRVLTTSQLAESYGTDTKIINNNFGRNKDRYTEGKHYYEIRGTALDTFKGSHQIDDNLKFASVLYLWTEKGAWLHAKSLNTDEAWEAYEMLIDDYYQIKSEQQLIDTSKLSPEMQMFHHVFQSVAKMQIESAETKRLAESAQEKAENAVSTISAIKETFLQRDDNWRDWVKRMLNKAVSNTNRDFHGIRSKSYQILTERGRCDLDKRLRGLRSRLEESGATKTQINDANKLDCIEAEPRLKEIYTTIVKELSLGSLL